MVEAKQPDECPKCLAFIGKTAGLSAVRCLTDAHIRRNVFCRMGISFVFRCETWPYFVKRDLLMGNFSKVLESHLANVLRYKQLGRVQCSLR